MIHLEGGETGQSWPQPGGTDLASHPRAAGAGELQDLRRLAGGAQFPELAGAATPDQLNRLAAGYLAALRTRAPQAERIVDKMPGNFQLIGLIRTALPQARIIHVRRDPLDTCMSCFSRLFASGDLPFTYDLAELRRYYRAYESLMGHWRLKTASAMQVRRPPYRSSIGRWRSLGEAQRPLTEALGG